MPKYEIAPTKTNLINLKNQLKFAQQGHELLQQKKDILTAELLSRIDIAKDLQKQIDELFGQAFSNLEQTYVRMGKKDIIAIAANTNPSHHLSIKFRKIMGVTLPLVDTKISAMEPFYGFDGTTPYLDKTIYLFRKIVEIMGSFAQMRVAIIKLSRELQKTIRRVNALEKIYIPDHKETLKYIQDTLEEFDRETFFMLKTIKKRLIR